MVVLVLVVVVVDVCGVWWVKTKFHWGYLFIAAVHAHGACTAKATTDIHHTHACMYMCEVECERERHTQTHPEAMAEARLELRLTHLLLRKFVIKRFFKVK